MKLLFRKFVYILQGLAYIFFGRKFQSKTFNFETWKIINMELDSDLPFETLLKLQDTIGSKSFREYQVKGETNSVQKPVVTLQKFRESDDEGPEEMSSKFQPKKSLKKLLRPPRQAKSIDPRFSSRCGEYKEKHFKRNFQFAFDMKDQEIQELKKLRDDKKDGENAKYLVQRLENQKREAMKRNNVKKIKPVINPDGSKYFPSKKEIEAKELVEKYEELKNSGKLMKHLEKRRKKQAGKERKKLDL